MNERPAWLPPIISLDGVWEEILIRLYNVFEQDFKRTKKILWNMEVWCDRTIRKELGYEEGFFHLIEREDYSSGERLFDPRRAERLPWCGPTISNVSDAAVKAWYWLDRKRKVRIYVWLEKFDYVIILEKRQFRIGTVAFLVSAFYVDGPSKRRDLHRRYDERVQ